MKTNLYTIINVSVPGKVVGNLEVVCWFLEVRALVVLSSKVEDTLVVAGVVETSVVPVIIFCQLETSVPIA